MERGWTDGSTRVGEEAGARPISRYARSIAENASAAERRSEPTLEQLYADEPDAPETASGGLDDARWAADFYAFDPTIPEPASRSDRRRATTADAEASFPRRAADDPFAGDDLHAPEDLYDGAAYGLYPDHAAADRAADRSPEAAARFERDAAERPADKARAEEARADEARADEARAGETPARGGEAADAARAFARLTTALSWLWGRAGRLTTRRPRPVEDEDLIAPALRQAFAQGAPLIAGAAAAAAVIAFPPTREAAVRTIDSLHRAVLSRPELAVRRIELIGAERVDATAVIAALGLTPDAHASLGFDAAEARDRIEALGWVKHARVALRPPQTLEIEVRERTPALLWRVDGRLWLLDPKGAKIEAPLSRRAWPGLPLVVGQDADKALDEAFQLDRAARLAGLPVAALTRIGARRWDLELVGGPRIRLPEDAPLDAVETAGRWAAERGILERGYELIDLRIAHAPVARLASAALGDRLQPGAAALSARETDEADAAADAAADLGEQVAETAPAHWRIPAPDIFQER